MVPQLLILAASIRVAIPAFTVEHAPEPLSLRVPQFFASALEDAQCATTVAAESMPNEVLSSFDKCANQPACLGAAGRSLGVDFVLTGTVSRTGDTYVFAVAATSVKSSQSVGKKEIRYEGDASGLATGVKNNIGDVCKLLNPSWTSPSGEAALAQLAFDDGKSKPAAASDLDFALPVDKPAPAAAPKPAPAPAAPAPPADVFALPSDPVPAPPPPPAPKPQEPPAAVAAAPVEAPQPAPAPAPAPAPVVAQPVPAPEPAKVEPVQPEPAKPAIAVAPVPALPDFEPPAPEPAKPAVAAKAEPPAPAPEPAKPEVAAKPEAPAPVPEPAKPVIAANPEAPAPAPESAKPEIAVKPEPVVAAKPEAPAPAPEPAKPLVAAKPEAPAPVPEPAKPEVAAKPEAPALAPEAAKPEVAAKPEAPAAAPEPAKPELAAKPEIAKSAATGAPAQPAVNAEAVAKAPESGSAVSTPAQFAEKPVEPGPSLMTRLKNVPWQYVGAGATGALLIAGIGVGAKANSVWSGDQTVSQSGITRHSLTYSQAHQANSMAAAADVLFGLAAGVGALTGTYVYFHGGFGLQAHPMGLQVQF